MNALTTDATVTASGLRATVILPDQVQTIAVEVLTELRAIRNELTAIRRQGEGLPTGSD